MCVCSYVCMTCVCMCFGNFIISRSNGHVSMLRGGNSLFFSRDYSIMYIPKCAIIIFIMLVR